MLRWISIGLILLGLGLWLFLALGGPRAPEPNEYETLDPMVTALIQEGVSAVNRSRRDPELRKRLGMVYEANGLPELALKCFEQAVRQESSNPKLWYRIALVRHRLADVDGALDALAVVRELAPEYPPLLWRTGFWLMIQGRLDEAERVQLTALERSPGDPAASYGLARVYLKQGRPAEAAELIEQSHLGGRHEAVGKHLLLSAYRQIGRVEEARTLAVTADPAEPNWHDPWAEEAGRFRTGYAVLRLTAATFIAEGRNEEALPIIEELRSQRGDDGPLLNMLGTALFNMGEIDRGLDYLRQSVTLDPHNATMRLTLARRYLQLSQGRDRKLEMARAEVERVREIDPDFADAHAVLGSVYRREGRIEEAIDSYRAAFELDNRDIKPLIEAGGLLLQLQKSRDAFDVFQQALNVKPDAGDAHVGMAVILTHQGRFDEAETALRHAAELSSTTPHRLDDAWRRLQAAQAAVLGNGVEP